LCFLALIDGLHALAGALTLPYIAVIAANAGRETIKKEAIFNPKRKRLN